MKSVNQTTDAEHMTEDCCSEECPDCGAGPGEKCLPDCSSRWRDPLDLSGVEDGFGNVHSDADMEAPTW